MLHLPLADLAHRRFCSGTCLSAASHESSPANINDSMSSAAALAARPAASSPPAQRMRAYTSGTGIQVHSSRHFLVTATAASTRLRGTPPTHACLQAARTTTRYAYGRHRRPSQTTKARAGGGTRETMVPYESLLLFMYFCIWRVSFPPTTSSHLSFHPAQLHPIHAHR
jgi:hypothetical protein